MYIRDHLHNNEFHSSQIREQLIRIREDNGIKKSELLCHFLEFIVEETIAGRVKEIKEYTIGTRALGRPTDFNPQFDPAVRIHAGRLRRTLNEYYNGPGRNDPIRIEIPKGTYVPVFNTTASACPKNAGMSSSSADTGMHIVGEGDRPAGNDDETGYEMKKMTLAVFPFMNLSEDAGRDHFVDGLGEQLSIELSRFQDISMVSYFATISAADRHTELRQAAAALGAHYIITGSVRFSLASVRVNIQLIFAESNEQVWAETFDRDLNASSLEIISDKIIKKTASCLAGYYGIIMNAIGRTSQPRRDKVLRGYDAAFWYCQYTREHDFLVMLKARSALEHALGVNPEYALAWGVLGELYLDSYILELSEEDMIITAMDYAQKAIRLDRYCQHGYQTLAWACLLQHEREACIETMEGFLAQFPNSTNAIGWAGSRFIFLGEYERGRELLETAISMTPFYPWIYSLSLALYYYCHKKDYYTALLWIKKVNMPSQKIDLIVEAAILGQLNDRDNMDKAFNKLYDLWPRVRTEVRSFLQRFILDDRAVRHIVNGLLG